MYVHPTQADILPPAKDVHRMQADVHHMQADVHRRQVHSLCMQEPASARRYIFRVLYLAVFPVFPAFCPSWWVPLPSQPMVNSPIGLHTRNRSKQRAQCSLTWSDFLNSVRLTIFAGLLILSCTTGSHISSLHSLAISLSITPYQEHWKLQLISSAIRSSCGLGKSLSCYFFSYLEQPAFCILQYQQVKKTVPFVSHSLSHKWIGLGRDTVIILIFVQFRPPPPPLWDWILIRAKFNMNICTFITGKISSLLEQNESKQT